jgi:hypothetical protein
VRPDRHSRVPEFRINKTALIVQAVLARGRECGVERMMVTGGNLEESKKAIQLAKVPVPGTGIWLDNTGTRLSSTGSLKITIAICNRKVRSVRYPVPAPNW